MVLGMTHYTYLIIIVLIIVTMCFKKDVVLPCLIGIALIGYQSTGNLVSTVQILYRAVLVSGKEFIEIIIIISLVNTMSKVLKAVGADDIMIGPIRKLMVGSTRAFFILGITMMVLSWFIWPTAAVAFIGAIMIPAAVKAGLSPIWAAVAINIFGNGIALSSDFFIQGAPSITAKTAGVDNPYGIINASLPIWGAMSVVVVAASYILMRKETRTVSEKPVNIEDEQKPQAELGAKLLAFGTPLFFLADVVTLYLYKFKGGEATALIGGTAIVIIATGVVIKYGYKKALGEITGLVREGAMFGIRVFAPIVVIGAFFFLGSKDTAGEILNIETQGYLTDIGTFIASVLPMTRFSAILMQSVISILLGIGGSGFSGLPLIGSLSEVFSSSVNISGEGLAALGQITTIWVGGGTIIPWSVVPVAAMCDVQPFEIVRRNLLPVTLGIIIINLISIIIY